MQQLDRETDLPKPRRRSRRRDWGRLFARLLCVLLAIIGVLPLGLGLFVRSGFARAWATKETARILREQGVDAKYEIAVRLWPLAVELAHVEIASNDGGAPALTCQRISAQPRFFALLSGKLVVQQIEADDPHVRLVLHAGEIKNLDLKLPKKTSAPKTGPFHAPFGVVAVTDADLDLDIDGSKLVAHEVDADVTVDDDRDRGSSFEVALRIGQAEARNTRITFPQGPDNPPLVAKDDDALCAVDARVRIEPDLVLVRRLEAQGSADLDVVGTSVPRCNLPVDDKRRTELSLSHLRVRLPEKKSDLPRIDGHIKARLPLGIAERVADLPQTDGWLGIDADVRFAEDTTIPDIAGHFEAHGIALERYRFAREIQADLQIRRNVVTSPKMTVAIADGLATISDITVEPLAKGIPMKARLDAVNVSFTSLMRDLGVARHPHVAWDLKEVHAIGMHGTLAPLHLDGEITAKTPNLWISTMEMDNPAHDRVIGFKEGQLTTHVSVRPDALEFHNVNGQLAHTRIEGGTVSLGFHEVLLVDVPHATIDLADIGPLGTIPIAGVVDTSVHVAGPFGDPKLDGEIKIADFILGDTPFGSVTAGKVHFEKDVVDLSGVKAQKNKSTYEMPTARLDFGRHHGLHMDAVATSTALGARDFLAIWKMDDDPRFAEIDGTIATQANVHIALGGPEDVCGAGFFDVRATVHVKDLKLYGETFEDGDLDLEYKWTDRLAGIEGADVDIRALTLHKAHADGTGAPLGSILASGAIQRGGELRGSAVIEALPLSRVDQLGAFKRQVEGSVSGIAQIGGRVDAFTVNADVDVTPIRVRGAPLGSSHLHVAMLPRTPDDKPTGKTRCGGRIFPQFDKQAFLRNAVSQGEYQLDGELFGGQVKLERLTVSREKASLLTGSAQIRNLDLGAISRMSSSPAQAKDDGSPSDAQISGELSGDLVISRLKMDDLGTTRARFAPHSLTVSRGGQKLVLRPAPVNFVIEQDKLIVPPLVFDLNAQNGLRGAFIVRGDVDRLTRGASLDLTAELLPVDLGLLVGVVPKVERATGTLSGIVRVRGTAGNPAVDGTLKVQGGELALHGLSGTISEIEVDVRADANEIRVARASAKLLGGTVAVTEGRIPIKEGAFGSADAQVTARGLRVAPAEGVSATLDADLAVSYNAQATGAASARLPHVSGDVLLTSFDYTRPINLLTDLGGFKVGGAKRTNVETYDPTQDAVVLDVRVRSRAPLRIKNNLVEAQLAIDSGVVNVTGTNQRLGLRGDLKALPGGRFHLFANDFEVRQAMIRFDDPTRIAPNVDILAVTEYRRYTDTSAGAAAGASASDVGAAGGTGSGRVGGLWRISLHAYGDADNVRLEMTSDPALAQEDIFFLLTVGLTRSEVDQVQAGSLGASVAFQAVGTASGADRAVKAAIPVIDDFRFGSAYSSRTGRSEPQVTVGRRVTDNVRATVTTGLTEDRELRSNIEWRLSQKLSVQGSYDNINDVSSSAIGNVGGGFRWRLEFE